MLKIVGKLWESFTHGGVWFRFWTDLHYDFHGTFVRFNSSREGRFTHLHIAYYYYY